MINYFSAFIASDSGGNKMLVRNRINLLPIVFFSFSRYLFYLNYFLPHAIEVWFWRLGESDCFSYTLAKFNLNSLKTIINNFYVVGHRYILNTAILFKKFYAHY